MTTGMERVDPLLDLGSEMKNFDGHGFGPRTLPGAAGATLGMTPRERRRELCGPPADRFQYLSFNIP